MSLVHFLCWKCARKSIQSIALTYTLGDDDVGWALQVQVSYTDVRGGVLHRWFVDSDIRTLEACVLNNGSSGG